MSDIKPIPFEEFESFARIVVNAYPSFDSSDAEAVQRLARRMADGQQADDKTHLYGLYREGQLLGGMRLFDFTMNLLSFKVPVGGVGLVAVDLLHKKEKVAKELIEYFLRHYRERGASMVALYPFRPDFYNKMGFGYGTKQNQYRVKPANFPRSGAKERVRFAEPADKSALLECYTRYFEKTHGMIAKRPAELDAVFDNSEHRVVVYQEGERIGGYIVFQFHKGRTFVHNDIEVRELIYESREALAGLLAFLHSQLDQINAVVIHTQDEHFHYLLSDPRNGSENILPHAYHESNVAGVGLMYRVIDTAGLFGQLSRHNFNGQSCRLKLSIADSFFDVNNGSVIVHFDDGAPAVRASGPYDVELRLDVAEFSALIMGVVPLSRLYEYGLAEISDLRYLTTLDLLFRTTDKPRCTTRF